MVGIAVGTVLLPEMSRRLAAGDTRGAALAQARGIQLALLMTVPSVAGAIAIPDLIMRALFARGAFTAADAAAAGATLAAYAIGLLPFVMMRSFTAPFYARGDTLTPVKAALLAAAVNIALKVVLMGPLAQVGLALATSVGAWINLTLLTIFARRQRLCRVGCGASPGDQAFPGGRRARRRALFRQYRAGQGLLRAPSFPQEITLAVLLLIGTIVYAATVLLLLGRDWLATLFKDVGTAADTPPSKTLQPPDPTSASAALPDSTPPPNV